MAKYNYSKEMFWINILLLSVVLWCFLTALLAYKNKQIKVHIWYMRWFVPTTVKGADAKIYGVYHLIVGVILLIVLVRNIFNI